MSKAIIALPSSLFDFSEINRQESDEEQQRHPSPTQKNETSIGDEEIETLLRADDKTLKKDSIH
jgi:hypothetical protein